MEDHQRRAMTPTYEQFAKLIRSMREAQIRRSKSKSQMAIREAAEFELRVDQLLSRMSKGSEEQAKMFER